VVKHEESEVSSFLHGATGLGTFIWDQFQQAKGMGPNAKKVGVPDSDLQRTGYHKEKELPGGPSKELCKSDHVDVSVHTATGKGELLAGMAKKNDGSTEVGVMAGGDFNAIELRAHAAHPVDAVAGGNGVTNVSGDLKVDVGQATGEVGLVGRHTADGHYELGAGLKFMANAATVRGNVQADMTFMGEHIGKFNLEGAATAGAGAEMEGVVEYEDGKLHMHGVFGAAFGFGGIVAPSVDLDLKEAGRAAIKFAETGPERLLYQAGSAWSEKGAQKADEVSADLKGRSAEAEHQGHAVKAELYQVGAEASEEVAKLGHAASTIYGVTSKALQTPDTSWVDHLPLIGEDKTKKE
jgi:hypothetical protein